MTYTKKYKQYKSTNKKRSTRHKRKMSYKDKSIKVYHKHVKTLTRKRVKHLGGDIEVPLDHYVFPYGLFSGVKSYQSNIPCLEKECKQVTRTNNISDVCDTSLLIIYLFKQRCDDYAEISIIKQNLSLPLTDYTTNPRSEYTEINPGDDSLYKNIQQTNRKYLVTYVNSLYKTKNDDKLKELLTLINPPYYYYLISPTNTQLDILIQAKIIAVHTITTPAELMTLLLNYCSTPYDIEDDTLNKIAIQKTLILNATIDKVEPLVNDEKYLTIDKTWDMTGLFEPVSVPSSDVLTGKQLTHYIKALYSEAFIRVTQIVLIKADGTLIYSNDETRSSNDILQTKLDFIESFGNSIIVDENGNKLDKLENYLTSITDVMPSELFANDADLNLLQRVYTISTQSLTSRLDYILSPNGPPLNNSNMGIYGLFATYIDPFRTYDDPESMDPTNPSQIQSNIVRYGMGGYPINKILDANDKLSIITFIDTHMPKFIEYFNTDYMIIQNGEDIDRTSWLIVDLINNSVQILIIMANGLGGGLNCRYYVEITNYTNINSNEDIVATTHFLIIWVSPTTEDTLKTTTLKDTLIQNCKDIYESVYKNVYDDMKAI